MKRRVTYINRANDAFDQDQIEVDKSSIQLRDLKAAREDRLTLALDELSYEASLLV